MSLYPVELDSRERNTLVRLLYHPTYTKVVQANRNADLCERLGSPTKVVAVEVGGDGLGKTFVLVKR